MLLQSFIGKKLLLQWFSQRAEGIKNLQLDFDDWCRRYYQGCFSATQASSTVADVLRPLQGSLRQLKLLDSGYVVNRGVLQSIAVLSQLQHLQLFGLSPRTLVSADLSVITTLSLLKNLELSDNNESREAVKQQQSHFFPITVCNLPCLVRLHIQSPLVTYIDSSITRLRKLRTLMVSNCAIQQVPSFLTELDELATLNLADNAVLALDKSVEQWWPDELARMTSLTDLDLSLCNVASVPMSLTRLHRLRQLDLSANSAHPVMMLPSMLTSCISLERLKLSDLGLTNVPPSICMMTSLRRVVLTSNELRTLPSELAALTLLQDLELGHNQFESFPMVLTELPSLERVSLQGCTNMQITCSLEPLLRLTRLTSLILTCDLSRDEPRWSADSTSRLISLACGLDRVKLGRAKMLRF